MLRRVAREIIIKLKVQSQKLKNHNMMPKGENGLILMLKLDKKKHPVDHQRRVGRLERSKERIFISRKGQGEVTPMLLKVNKAKLQAAKVIALNSSQSPNGNQEIVKEIEVINFLAATKEQEAVCSTGHGSGGASMHSPSFKKRKNAATA